MTPNDTSPPEGSKPSLSKKAHLSGHFRRYFITGLLVVVPIWGTYLVLKTLFVTMDGVLGNIMKSQGLYYLPGFGIVILLGIILFAGLFTTNIFGKRLFALWERLLDQVPLVRNVYSMVKSLVDTLSFQSGSNDKFRRVVLLEYPRKGLYTYAFVTGDMHGSIPQVSSQRVLSVFVPTVPNPISGFIIMIPELDTIPLTISVEDAMKIVFSVGLFSPELHVDALRRPQEHAQAQVGARG